MSGFRKPQQLQRPAKGEYVDGTWVPGALLPFTILASVQPLSDDDLVNLPAGRRASDMVKMYTSDDLVTLEDRGEDQQPDRLFWRGFWYELSSKSVRQMDVINHYRYWATRIPDGAL